MGFGGAWFLCKYANRTASRESLFSRFDTWLQYTENKGFEQNKFYKRIIEPGPRDRRYFKPARVEVKNWSGKYINRSALNWDRTQDAAETRRSTVSFLVRSPGEYFFSSFRHFFSVWIKFDELLALCNCNSLQLFLSTSSTFPNNVAMQHINWQSEWVWLQNMATFPQKLAWFLS